MGNHEHKRPKPVPHRLRLQAPLGLAIREDNRCWQGLEDNFWQWILWLVDVHWGNKQEDSQGDKQRRQEAGVFLLQGKGRCDYGRQVCQQSIILSVERCVQGRRHLTLQGQWRARSWNMLRCVLWQRQQGEYRGDKSVPCRRGRRKKHSVQWWCSCSSRCRWQRKLYRLHEIFVWRKIATIQERPWV